MSTNHWVSMQGTHIYNHTQDTFQWNIQHSVERMHNLSTSSGEPSLLNPVNTTDEGISYGATYPVTD